MPPTANLLIRTLTVLGCLVSEPRLGGVLLLDLDSALLVPLARWLADRLHDGDHTEPHPTMVMLGSWVSEEELWLQTHLTRDGFRVTPGLLVEDPAAPPPVVVIPDLCRAGMPVTRAAVTLVGADAASAEALGHSIRWRPRARWVAAADRAEVAQLSPHLLDRFPIRVNAAGLAEAWPGISELTATTNHPHEVAVLHTALPAPGGPVGRALPPLTADAVRQVVATVRAGPSRRRELALGRVARALAASVGETAVTPDHVIEAADLLGIAAHSDTPMTRSENHHDLRVPQPPTASSSPPLSTLDATPGGVVTVSPGLVPVADSGPGRPLEATPTSVGIADDWPYPEDDPKALPMAVSLRVAPRHTSTQLLRGHRIGVRPALQPHDLAIVSTVLEAVKYQTIRPRHIGMPVDRLIISPADLRCHRRRSEPRSALVLVLDHSCQGGWDVASSMASYLRWAYSENAAISVVEFGHRANTAELAAVRYRLPSLLDPRLLASLNRPPGRASPLAHALDLALHELRRLVRRSGAPVDDAVLLVVTDGRGNVPLEASLRGITPHRVGRLGVADALTVAAAVRSLPRVRAIVIAPDGDQYVQLPFDLAEAMGGVVVLAPRLPEPGEQHH